MPVGLPHWFRNEGDRPAKLLILAAPGGMEEMFRRTGTPATDPAASIPPLGDDEKRRIAEAAPDFGIELLPGGHG